MNLTSTVEGLIGNDELTVNSYQVKDSAGDDYAGAAGTYTITPVVEFASGVKPTNYEEIEVVPGTLTVTDKPLALVTVEDGITEFTFNNEAQAPEIVVMAEGKALNPDNDYTVTFAGKNLNGDSVNVKPKDAGSYTATVALKGDAATKYTLAGNYVIPFTIKPMDVEFKWNDYENQPYSGTTITVLPEGKATVGSSNLSVEYDSDPKPVKDVGDYTRTVALESSSTSFNYNLTNTTKSFKVVPMEVTITPKADQSKIYGSSDPVLEYNEVTLPGGDAITGTLSRAPGEDVTDAGYAINIGSLTAGKNYLWRCGHR